MISFFGEQHHPLYPCKYNASTIVSTTPMVRCHVFVLTYFITIYTREGKPIVLQLLSCDPSLPISFKHEGVVIKFQEQGCNGPPIMH